MAAWTVLRIIALALIATSASAGLRDGVAGGGRHARFKKLIGNQDVIPISYGLPRAFRNGAPVAAVSGQPSRRLLQVAGVANFLTGATVAASQRAINAVGVAGQLANWYGLEGLGMRHRFGALPAPGGLELMALAGPKAFPGPTGMAVGWLGGTVEAIANSANPVQVAATTQAFQDIASSQGHGTLVGAEGFSGLGLGTGLAATAGSSGLNGLGPLGAGAALLNQPGLASLGGGGLGVLNAAGLGGISAAGLGGLGAAGLGGSGGAGLGALGASSVLAAKPTPLKRVGEGLTAMGKAIGSVGQMASAAANALKPGSNAMQSAASINQFDMSSTYTVSPHTMSGTFTDYQLADGMVSPVGSDTYDTYTVSPDNSNSFTDYQLVNGQAVTSHLSMLDAESAGAGAATQVQPGLSSEQQSYSTVLVDGPFPDTASAFASRGYTAG